MCLAFRIAGYKIWYDEKLRFSHYIDPERLTLDYLKKLKLGMSNSSFVSRFYRDYLLTGYRPKVNQMFWLREIVNLLKQILSEMFYRKNERSDSIDRNIRLMKFILDDPIDYNKKVRWVLKTCDRLATSASSGHCSSTKAIN